MKLLRNAFLIALAIFGLAIHAEAQLGQTYIEIADHFGIKGVDNTLFWTKDFKTSSWYIQAGFEKNHCTFLTYTKRGVAPTSLTADDFVNIMGFNAPGHLSDWKEVPKTYVGKGIEEAWYLSGGNLFAMLCRNAEGNHVAIIGTMEEFKRRHFMASDSLTLTILE